LVIDAPVVLELQPEAPRTLEVLDRETGEPVAGAWVGWRDQDRRPAPDSFRTNERGEVTLHGLAPSTVASVIVAAPSYVERVAAASAGQVLLAPARRTVRWPLQGAPPPNGTPVRVTRPFSERVVAEGFIEGDQLVVKGLPAGDWPEHVAVLDDGRLACIEAASGESTGRSVRFEAKPAVEVWLRDTEGVPVDDYDLRLEDPITGAEMVRATTDPSGRARFAPGDGTMLRLAGRAPGATHWRPLRDEVGARAEVLLPAARRLTLRGALPDRLAVYVDGELREPDEQGALTLRPRPDARAVDVALLAHGFVAQQRRFDLAQDREWNVTLAPATSLVVRVRGAPGELVLADPATGDVRRRGPLRFRLDVGPDGMLRDTMVPPGRHVIRDLARGESSFPFEATGEALRFDLDMNEERPVVEGRVLLHAGVDRGAVQLEAAPGGPLELARDGRFRFPWSGPTVVQLRMPDGTLLTDRVDRPDHAVRFQPEPRAILRVAHPADAAGRLLATGEDGRTLILEGRADGKGSWRYGALRPGRYDLWFDLPGFAPLRRRDVLLGAGETKLEDLAPSPGATLEVRWEGDGSAPSILVRVQSIEEPRYQRAGGTDVRGLGVGRFRVTVWDRYTALPLYRGAIESDGRSRIPLTLDLR
ncbi:MAG: carboxypeptidase-like regulatory domain-containing protein, partial [Planctomycetota bacterium]